MSKLFRSGAMIILMIMSQTTFLFGEESPDYLRLYDFNRTDNNSHFEWKDFTDQVMGGKSEMTSFIVREDNENYLRMRGEVSLKNNGGFIQTRLQLASGLKSFNGESYDGVRLKVRGNGSGYYLFFRTSATVFPWKYYAGAIPLTEEWQLIDIPWSEIKKGDYGNMGKFDPSKLKSIALVAYGKEFQAQVDLKQIGLYK